MSLQLGLTIAPRMKQELKLTPQLQLSIRHLQLSRMDLIEEIQQELMSNPLLEDQRVGEESAVLQFLGPCCFGGNRREVEPRYRGGYR